MALLYLDGGSAVLGQPPGQRYKLQVMNDAGIPLPDHSY